MNERDSVLVSVPEAIEEYRRGRFVVITDDEDRENEGDLVMAAQFVTPDAINFMAKYGRGLICIPLTEARVAELKLPMMAEDNSSHFGTPFTVSVEARLGVTTGISAGDRARTVQVLIDPASGPEDVVRPGHMFPLRARNGGVLVRAGQTEAAVDLAKMAGLYPAGVLCEIMKADGEMARMPDLKRFARRHGLKIVTVADMIKYRLRHEKLVQRVVETKLPVPDGEMTIVAYRAENQPDEHVALVKGPIDPEKPVLVRVHDQCVTGDVFDSLRCDCGEQKDRALKMIAEEGGVFLYMRQEGRGIGLHNKLRAYELQDQGMDTVEANIALGFPADRRDYGIGMQILRDIGVRKMRLITNNPAKRAGLEAYGLEVVERIPIETEPNPFNIRYLDTKRRRMGHLLDGLESLGGGEVGVPEIEGSLDGAGLRVCVVVARWNEFVTRKLMEGAVTTLHESGLSENDVTVAWVPGSFEVPTAARWAAMGGRFDAIICLGAVIRGETAHFEYVAGGAAEGIAAISRDTGIPVIFGVLTVDSVEQALARAGGKDGHKGEEAAHAAIAMANLHRQLTEV